MVIVKALMSEQSNINSMRQCSGSENLTELKNPFTDLSELRISNNVYKAVYTVAHSVQNLLNCTDGQHPFEARECILKESIKPGQVRMVVKTVIVLLPVIVSLKTDVNQYNVLDYSTSTNKYQSKKLNDK